MHRLCVLLCVYNILGNIRLRALLFKFCFRANRFQNDSFMGTHNMSTPKIDRGSAEVIFLQIII
jgi:hypothetical protein